MIYAECRSLENELIAGARDGSTGTKVAAQMLCWFPPFAVALLIVVGIPPWVDLDS